MYENICLKKGGAVLTGALALAMLASCELLTGLSSSYFCEISEEEISLVEGQSHLLTATVRSSEEGETDFDRTVVWSSSNKEVAQVDENGKVTALAPGKATISAKPQAGGKAATCVVTVTKQPTYAWVRTKILDFPGESGEYYGSRRTITTEKNVDKNDSDKITISFIGHWTSVFGADFTKKASATNVIPKTIRENQRLDFSAYLFIQTHREHLGISNGFSCAFDQPNTPRGFAYAGCIRFKTATGTEYPIVQSNGKIATWENNVTVSLEKMFKGKKEGDMISLYLNLDEYMLEAQYKWTQVD